MAADAFDDPVMRQLAEAVDTLEAAVGRFRGRLPQAGDFAGEVEGEIRQWRGDMRGAPRRPVGAEDAVFLRDLARAVRGLSDYLPAVLVAPGGGTTISGDQRKALLLGVRNALAPARTTFGRDDPLPT